MNSLYYVVNACEEERANTSFVEQGVNYFNLNWNFNVSRILFRNLQEFDQMFNFIDNALEKSETVLIYSPHGRTRAAVCVTLYLANK